MRRFAIATVKAGLPAVALALAFIFMPFAANGQQGAKITRIGYLSQGFAAEGKDLLDLFRQSLRELGYIEGQNVSLEVRWSDGKPERLRELSIALVRLNVDVLVATSGFAAVAAKEVTQTVPIVMVASGDPVKQGLVASLARPGGNVTGLTNVSTELSRKRLELLREALPRLSRVGVLWCGASLPVGERQWTETQAAAKVLGVQLWSLEAAGPDDLDGAFALAAKQRVQAILMFDCSRISPASVRIVGLAQRYRLPAMYPYGRYPDAGGLMSYGPNIQDPPRRAASYVDKILKGAKPGDLPVEQPVKFDLAINMKTAAALGLTVPASLAARADRVIP
jgi:putative tryptophan/tyrosine transport system substrate-binding protein